MGLQETIAMDWVYILFASLLKYMSAGAVGRVA